MNNDNISDNAQLHTGNELHWRVNTCGLLQEILTNKQCAILKVPLQCFADILSEVAERAIELNDPKLHAIMCKLGLYAQSDPYSPEYDKELTNEIINKFY